MAPATQIWRDVAGDQQKQCAARDRRFAVRERGRDLLQWEPGYWTDIGRQLSDASWRGDQGELVQSFKYIRNKRRRRGDGCEWMERAAEVERESGGGISQRLRP